MATELRPGDKVRFLNEAGEARIIRFESDTQAVVEDDNGFEYPYATSELLKVEDAAREASAYKEREPNMQEMLRRDVDPDKLKRAQKGFKDRYKEREDGPVRYRGDVVEVDLHMHELMDNQAGLDPKDMLDIQMEHFERMMRRAEHERHATIVFIHGVGEGILRAEIRKHLELYYPKASFHDADYGEYGYGATEVNLRFN